VPKGMATVNMTEQIPTNKTKDETWDHPYKVTTPPRSRSNKTAHEFKRKTPQIAANHKRASVRPFNEVPDHMKQRIKATKI